MAIRHIVGVGSRVAVGGGFVNLVSPLMRDRSEGGVVGMAICHIVGVGSRVGLVGPG